MDKTASPVLLTTLGLAPLISGLQGKNVGQQPLFLLITCLGLKVMTATSLEKLLEGQ